ncbi:MAG: hypothetical protein NTV80_04625 [Verrucomicrobia bacterium]|nr:hypothetical protein [Verrucomicrobiota bacterium]
MQKPQPIRPFSLIIIASLLAMVLGSAWLGYHGGGSAPVDSSHAKVQDSDTEPDTSDQPPPIEDDVTLAKLLERFRLGDSRALDDILPIGITEISGSGGNGLQRQVRAHGTWHPVFDLSGMKTLDDGNVRAVQLNAIPLSIATPHPPAGQIKQPFAHRFNAVGGVPPYSWRIEIDDAASGFQLNAATGDYTGQSESELTLPLVIYVSDSAGTQASGQSTLSIATEEPLTITTTTLPAMETPRGYRVTLTGSGGAKPYTWSLETSSPGWLIDAKTGIHTNSKLETGDHDLLITLQDQATSVERQFELKVTLGLDITTKNPLPPAAPKANYSGQFEASGGTSPYTWSLLNTELPNGWTFTPEGVLSGTTPDIEALLKLPVRVTDSDGLTFDKTFKLNISRGLLAVPSDRKVGLAWRYKEMRQALQANITGVSLKRNGSEIYRGRGSNYVDHGLAPGSSPNYELTAITSSGTSIPYAAALTTILPFSKQQAQDARMADPYADAILNFTPLSRGGYGASNVPNNILGPPNGTSTFIPAYLPAHVVSLHASQSGGGSIVLQFTNNIIESAPGPDFTLFENVFFMANDPKRRFMEPAVVEVAIHEDEWYRFPCRVQVAADGSVDLKQPSYYTSGFTGINATTGDDPTDPTRSGGDSFDLSSLGRADLTWIRFIRIIATGDSILRDSTGIPIRHTSENNALNGRASSGFDLDSASAVNY